MQLLSAPIVAAYLYWVTYYAEAELAEYTSSILALKDVVIDKPKAPLYGKAGVFDEFSQRRGVSPVMGSLFDNFMFVKGLAIAMFGQGMHFVANAITRQIKQEGLTKTTTYVMADYFDEDLGHWFWHIGAGILTFAVLRRQCGPAIRAHYVHVPAKFKYESLVLVECSHHV